MKTFLYLFFCTFTFGFVFIGCKKGETSQPVDTSGSLLDTKIEKIVSNKDNTASMKITVQGLRYTSNLTGVLNYNCDVSFDSVSGPLFDVKLHYKFRRWPSNYVNVFGYQEIQPAEGNYTTVDPVVFPIVNLYEFTIDPGPLDVFEVTLP
jgi:hypothetical protein